MLEQVLNFRAVKPAGDQYAAAASLYFLLTGKPHYEPTASMPDFYKRILQEDPVSSSSGVRTCLRKWRTSSLPLWRVSRASALRMFWRCGRPWNRSANESFVIHSAELFRSLHAIGLQTDAQHL